MSYLPGIFSKASNSFDYDEVKVFKLDKTNKGLYKIDYKLKYILILFIILFITVVALYIQLFLFEKNINNRFKK